MRLRSMSWSPRLESWYRHTGVDGEFGHPDRSRSPLKGGGESEYESSNGFISIHVSSAPGGSNYRRVWHFRFPQIVAACCDS